MDPRRDASAPGNDEGELARSRLLRISDSAAGRRGGGARSWLSRGVHACLVSEDAVQRHLTFRQQTEIIALKFEAYDPVQVAVEANAYQAAQVDELRRTTRVRVKPVTTTTDKVTRYMKLSARFEAGQVFLPRTGADELVEQLLLAPEGQHDDLLDALDFAVQAATESSSRPELTLPKIPDWANQRRRRRAADPTDVYGKWDLWLEREHRRANRQLARENGRAARLSARRERVKRQRAGLQDDDLHRPEHGGPPPLPRLTGTEEHDTRDLLDRQVKHDHAVLER